MHCLQAAAAVMALHISIWHILLILVALGVLLTIFMVISAARVRVHKRDFYFHGSGTRSSPAVSSPLTSLYTGSSGAHSSGNSSASSGCIPDSPCITVGFFSDTHGFGCLRSPSWIARQFLDNHCDIVLFGGDCVHKKTVRRSDLRMLTEVSADLKARRIELLSVYGNHDWGLTPEDYEKMGAILLLDTWKEVSFSGLKMAICGIADNQRGERPWGSIPDDFAAYDGFRLLLVHNPDFIYTLPDYSGDKTAKRPFDYMLSGHLHGGQVHLPGNLEFTFFREDRIAREAGILGGAFESRGYRGFISRGAGNGFLPIRLAARPEIHILRFHI
ncbi:MAG: metallophosphoesterase [Clostridiales bacterium]|nr:metallophosphoesterase [Clostridiales bacterium]